MNRKRRFLFGSLFVMLIYALPIAGFAFARVFSALFFTLVAFAVSIYLVYHMTMRNIKLKYPIVSPEGHPDVYTGRMPRPISDDVQRYPWFFKKKRVKKLESKKIKKKH